MHAVWTGGGELLFTFSIEYRLTEQLDGRVDCEV